VIDMIGALKKSLGKVSPTQSPLAQGSIQRQAEKSFTFDQFKSAIAKSGLKLSEQTLHKSYAALVKLRKNNHWSWAQTRRKMEHSQQDRAAAQSSARRQKTVQIPLTVRDWRRIG
jgi:replication initiation and membrane attachment protein DnaB